MNDIKFPDPKAHAQQEFLKFWASFCATFNLTKKEEDLVRIAYMQGYIDSLKKITATT